MIPVTRSYYNQFPLGFFVLDSAQLSASFDRNCSRITFSNLEVISKFPPGIGLQEDVDFGILVCGTKFWTFPVFHGECSSEKYYYIQIYII